MNPGSNLKAAFVNTDGTNQLPKAKTLNSAHIRKARRSESKTCLYAFKATNTTSIENNWDIKKDAEPIDNDKKLSSLLEKLTSHC